MTQLGGRAGGDPLRRASWRFRWEWWWLERRAAADETRRVVASLRAWRLDGLPIELDLVTDAERITTAVFRHAGWRAELAHVTRFGREALAGVREAIDPIDVRDGGRYGPFWWLAVTAGPERAVVLGATLRVLPEGGWGGVPDGPDGPPGYGAALGGQPAGSPLGVAPRLGI